MFYESKLFKNEEALSPEYLPESLPHRENQIERIAKNIEPASKGKKPQNTFIFGSPGIGKTASIKFIFRQFEDYSGIKTIYINTWDYNTSPSILTKLVISLGFPIVRRGISKDEIMERLIEALNKMKGGLIICLDEVDQVINRDEKILYDLLRLKENQNIHNPIGLVMISNYRDIFLNVEPRIKSSLDIEEIEFKPYTIQEMKGILSERCKEVFRTGVIEEGVVLLCANHAINRGGDVRVGLELLRKASRITEEDNSDKVLVKHVKQVMPEVKAVKMEIMKEKLSGVDKNIVEILSKKNQYTSSELLDEYNKTYEKIAQNTLTQHVKHLKKIGIVRTRIDRSISRGRKVFISLMKRKTFK